MNHNKLRKILKEMGTPDHLICLLRNLYAGHEAKDRPEREQQIGSQRQRCVLSPCLFIFYSEYIMQNPWLDEAQAGIKIAGRNISNLRYTMTPALR